MTGPPSPVPESRPPLEYPEVRASWIGTLILLVSLAIGVASPTRLGIVTLVVSLLLLLGGIAAFTWSFVVAAARSRTELLSVAGLYLLSEGAPSSVRRHLMGAELVQVVSCLTAASIRPFTPVAFGILAPVYGLGVAGVWSARHGRFRPRTQN
ncbi:MAG TPA: hypothetical protein ENI86_08760 [Acidimicrobiales bacterium]|nr:hypothetical protein [Acidimicrobiales bacterium]